MNSEPEKYQLDEIIEADKDSRSDYNNPEYDINQILQVRAEAQDMTTLAYLKRRVASVISHQMMSGVKDFFQRPQKQNSKSYLNDISYKVDLSLLIEVSDTCYINNDMKFCPIIVKKTIGYDGDGPHYIFLLQVWDDQGSLTYERELKSPIQAWFVTNDTLVYKTQDSNVDFHTIFIVLLEKKNATYKIKIPLNVFSEYDIVSFGYCNKCLYIGVNETISIYQMNMFNIDAGEIVVISNFLQIQYQPIVIDLGVKLHGFLITKVKKANDYLVLCCETNDNQIDFTLLYFFPDYENQKAKPVKKRQTFYMKKSCKLKSYELFQNQEVIKKERFSFDPIVNLKHVVIKGLHYSVAIRYSKNVDFYCNQVRISSTDEQSERYDQIDINFEAIYLKPQFSNVIKVIKLEWKGRMRLDVAEERKESDDFIFHKLFYQKIKNHVNLYQTFCMINTSLLIANNKDLYVYDIIKEEWIKKYSCQQKILKIFRNEKGPGQYNVSILLENGRFNLLDNDDTQFYNPEKWQLIMNVKYQISGTHQNIIVDKQYHRMLYVTSLNKHNEFILQGFHGAKLYNLKQNLNPNAIVLPMFYKSKDSIYIIYTPGDSQRPLGELEIYKHYSMRNANGIEELKLVPLRIHKDIEDACLSVEDPMKLVYKHQEKFHTAISNDLDKMVLILSQRNIYKVNIETKSISRILGTNVRSLHLVDNQYGYAIVEDNMNQQTSGLKIFFLNQLLSDGAPIFYDIDPSMTGIHNFIDFGEDNQRLAYLKTYDSINIIPPLHRTTINFMGMLPRDNYICCKKVGNEFMALDKNKTMTVWNTCTGKLLRKNQVDNDYSEYEIYEYEQGDNTYKREWYQPRTLLISNTPVYNIQDDQLYQDLECDIKDAVAYQYSQDKSYRMFKYIEIENESSVIEHLTFVNPMFRDRFQRIYISDDCDYMIQSVANMRDQLYVWYENGWKLKNRIFNFPSDLLSISYNLFLFTPDLQRYLNFDLKNGRFIIMNTLCDKIIFIPQALMDPKSGKQEDIVRRFKWVDNNHFLVASEWGQEKLIQIKRDLSLEELSSNQIPGFNKSDWANHLYVEPDSLELGDAYRRLRRKHQELKRNRFTLMDDIGSCMSDVLESIDYNVIKGTYKFVSDLSFSQFHWKLIEDIENNKINIQTIDSNTLKLLTLTILPSSLTFLHLLCRQSTTLSYLLKNVPIEDKSIGFEMPFIFNKKNKSPLHICIERKDFQSADLIVSFLANAPLDHHGKVIADVIPDLVSNNIPSLINYFDSRLISTPQLDKIKRGQLIPYGKSDIAMTTSRQWIDERQVKKDIIIETQWSSKIEHNTHDSDVSLQLLDIPLLYCYDNKVCGKFFDALNNTDLPQLFDLRSVRAMIEFLHPAAKRHTKYKLFYPFLFYLALFFVYNNWISNFGTGQNELIILMVTSSILLAFSFYFLLNEGKQILTLGYDYFASPWNYIDLIPPIIIIFICYLNLKFPANQYAWQNVFQAIGSLFMWLKLLYFFRMNQHTGHLIRMIVKVIYGMRSFLGVFIITTIAFTDAFMSIQIEHSNDQQQISKFFISGFKTYNMILGNFDPEEFSEEYRVTAAVLFVVCTVFMMIIMLNLLIAIIGETFGEVQSNQLNELYQEKVSIISENSYLVPDRIKRSLCPNDHYLIIGRQLVNWEIHDDSNQKDHERENPETTQKLKTLDTKLSTIEKYLEQINTRAIQKDLGNHQRCDKCEKSLL